MQRLSIIAAVIALLGCGQPESQQAPAEAPTPVATESPETQAISVARGVVVEEVPKPSALAKAGIQPGDLLLAWKRLPNPPANPEPAEGALDSPFDFHDLRIEQAPRGAVEISGEREGSAEMWRIESGSWRDVEVRPGWVEEYLELYLLGQQEMEGENLDEGARVWEELADRLGQEGEGCQRLWMLFELARFWLGSDREQTQKLENTERVLVFLKTPTLHKMESAYVLGELGEILRRRGDHDRAYRFHSRALEIRQEVRPLSLAVANNLNGLGSVAWGRGNLEQAEELYTRALEIRQELAPGSLRVAASLNNLGFVARLRGDLEQAQELITRSLKILKELAPGSLEFARALNNLGGATTTRGDLEQAQELLTRSVKILEELVPGSLEFAQALNNLGIVVRLCGDLEQAQELHTRSLKILKELVPGSLEFAQALNNLGGVATTRGDLEQAQELLTHSVKILEELAPGSHDVAASLNNLGLVAEHLGDLEQAQELLTRSVKIRERLTPLCFYRACSLFKLGNVINRQRESRRAVALNLQALGVLEHYLHLRSGSYRVQASTRARQQKIYENALYLSLLHGDIELGFHVLERFRARTFLKMLAERDIAFGTDLSEDLKQERQQLTIQRDRTLRKLAGLSATEDEEEVAAIRQELDTMERQRGAIEELARRASPRLPTLQYPEPLTAEAAQEALDPESLLLSYMVGEKFTSIFALSREGNLEVQTSPVGEESLRQLIERLRKLIDNDPSTRLGQSRARLLKQVSRELFNLLLAPLAERIEQSERLLILPDGPLHALPFAALIRENGGEDGKDQYLVEWKPFHLALSMTTYAELKKDRPASRQQQATSVQLAAFGDPSYPDSFTLPEAEARAAAVAPDAVLRSVTGRDLGFDWPPLPFTRHEVEGIAALFPQGQAQTFLGPEALEEHVKALDSGIRILHLAAHAFTDDHLPLSSFVALTIPEDLPEGRDNGLLQAWEILEQVRIEADLVVLSGCLTGLGQELRGEGLIGLTRAFHYAGARSLMSTLWSVKDQVTAELMIRFYRHLRSGLAKDEALRAAQLQMLQEPIYSVNEKGEPVELAHASAPASWAGVQLYGDWQ